MADLIFNRFVTNLATKQISLTGDIIKVALFPVAYVPNHLTQNVWADISAAECTGTGYTTGGAILASKTVTEDESGGGAVFDCADVTWVNSTITARYAVLYDDTLATKDLIAVYDFVTDKVSSGGDFVLTINASGLFKIA